MDLLILEACAALFLLLPMVRPVFKGLWNLNGIALLPLLALGLMIGLFPAYGFRPECLPLLFFAVYMSLLHSSAVGAIFSKLHNDDYRDQGPLAAMANFVLFGFAVWSALYFAPPLGDQFYYFGTVRLQNTENRNFLPPQTITLHDRSRNAELWLRIFAPDAGDAGVAAANAEKPALRPLLTLIPPVAGSVQVTDAVCAALRDKGFTVLSYSRPGFDSPAVGEHGEIKRLSPPGLFRLASALLRGLDSAAASRNVVSLEDGRKRDIVFLLEELSQNQNLRDSLPGTDLDCVFFAGYGAGGAALTVLSAAPGFTEQYGRIKGIIAVESPIFSDETSRPAIPLMFIVSGLVKEERGGRYGAILKTLKASRAPALVAALPGAGPFDYSDSPRWYPVYSFLFRGIKTEEVPDAAGFPVLTASLMANFAAFIMEQSAPPPETAAPMDAPPDETPPLEQPDAAPEGAPLPENAPAAAPPEKTALAGVYLETGGVWNLGDSRIILQP
jgi:hypothetical protein